MKGAARRSATAISWGARNCLSRLSSGHGNSSPAIAVQVDAALEDSLPEQADRIRVVGRDDGNDAVDAEHPPAVRHHGVGASNA